MGGSKGHRRVKVQLLKKITTDMEEWFIEVVLKFSIVLIVLLLILLTGITLQPRDWWWWKLGHTAKRRKKKIKSIKVIIINL